MADVIVQYPLDHTGQALTNYITGEQQVLTAVNHRNYHFIVPKYAPFFINNFRIFLNVNGRIRQLEEGKDFLFSLPFIGASRACAVPVYGAISFNNLNLAGVITMNYQTIGGSWVLDTEAALEVAANAVYNPRVTSWEVITEAPNVFPPVPHAWDLIDMVGEKELVEQLQKIEEAILTTATQAYTLHLNTFGNPHRTTKTHVGLGNVSNFGTATVQEMEAGVISNKFVTPAGLGILKANIHTHKTDLNNPHRVTKDQIGLSYLQNWPLATPTETIEGTATDRYVGLQGLQAKFNDFLSKVSNYVPSVAIQLLQTQMAEVTARVSEEESNSTSVNTTIQGIQRVLSEFNTAIKDSVKKSKTNLGLIAAQILPGPTLVKLAEKPNGYMGILKNIAYYRSLNIPVDEALYPGSKDVDYSLLKLTAKGASGVADFLLIDQINLITYIGSGNSGNTGIQWTRLLTKSEHDQIVARVGAIEQKNTLTNDDIRALNTNNGDKLVTFNNLIYYVSTYTQSNYYRVIDLTGLPSDMFFPLWWTDSSYLDKTGLRTYVSISRKEDDDFMLNPFNETYPDGTPVKEVGSLIYVIETNGCIISRPSIPVFKLKARGQTFRDFIRLPRYAMKCYFRYSNKAEMNLPRDANQEDYQVTSFKGGSGVYLRGGVKYMFSTNNAELLQSLNYSRTNTEVELGYYILSPDHTQWPGEQYPADNREMGFYTRAFMESDPFLEGPMPVTAHNGLPLASQADNVKYSNERIFHYYTRDSINSGAPIMFVNSNPSGTPTDTNPFD